MNDDMNTPELAIRISGVKKRYKLGQIGGGTLQADLQSWWARIRGKEDPNLRIGEEEKARLVGQTFMALNGIDLAVKKGEALGIIGGNGAGKSTLLKLISQVTAPSDGQIELWGRVASMLEVGTGFNGDMTGRENVYMNGAILGMTKAEIDAKMEDIIEFSEVRDFIDTPVKRYSSGMYVKLAFSVAAHLDSEIMIMDEVLAVGDMAFQQKCLTKMREAAKQEGRTVLYVSHNMNTIKQLCDRCIVLDKGRIVFDGNKDEAIALYLNSEENELMHIDYSDYKRPKWLSSTKVRIMSAEYIDGKNAAVYSTNEKMRVRLIWNNQVSYEKTSFRMEVVRLDRSPVTSAIVCDFCSGEKGERREAVFEISLQGLAPGKYATNYCFFEKNEFGSSVEIECVRGLLFEIDGNGSSLKWDNEYWGSMMLPPIKVLQ